MWRTRYDADPRIAGKIVRIKQQPYTVVGVVGFRSPLWRRGDLWVQYTMQPQFYRGYDGFKEHSDYPWLSVVGRLKSGYSQSDAQAELGLIQSQQDRQIPGRKTVLQVTNGSLLQNPQTRLLGFLIVPRGANRAMGPDGRVFAYLACAGRATFWSSRVAALVLGVAAFRAYYLPARRATQIAPTAALRRIAPAVAQAAFHGNHSTSFDAANRA